ncbi:MAG TPA: pitrilysin family protein, partial [Labilithrix sp.]
RPQKPEPVETPPPAEPAKAEPPPPVAPPPPAPTPVASAPPAPADPLGPKPDVAPPAPFTPPVAIEYKRANGLTVWLLERHALPIISMEVVLGAGASDDPAAKAGLAQQTANMLDEGAGTRGALELARDVDRLGATIHTGVYADYGFAQLTTLKKNLSAAATIFGDVLGKPTFSPVEWKRVHDLWTNDLKQRASEPAMVAGVVVARKLFGEGHPYAMPNDGTTKTAANVSLDDLKKFYADRWRPSRATCVVVGDVTRAELDAVLDSAFAGWKDGNATAGWSKSGKAPSKTRRIVVVDRADAPQSVIAVARQGVAASSPDAPALVRVNAALGGSFTSRLNQDLREEHGWSYGAKSRFSFNEFPGVFVAQAAVQTAHTGEALKAMLADLETYAKDGPTDAEVEKTRLLARGDLVEAYETVDATAHRLARYAGVGLAADQDATAAAKTSAATKADLAALAKKYVDPSNALVVIVGPRAKIAPQLEAIGMGSFETSGPEGE